MDWYVAGRFADRERVRSIQDRLRDLGHEITHDWTRHDPVKPYDANVERATKYAARDVEGVAEADVFVMLASEGGRTLHAELGAALALDDCEVFVVGDVDDPGLVYFHPRVRRVDAFEDVLTAVPELRG